MLLPTFFTVSLLCGRVANGESASENRKSNDNSASASSNRPVDSGTENNEKSSNTNNDFSGFQLLPTSANKSTFRCPEKFG